MAGNITNRIIKIIADSRGVVTGVHVAERALDGLAASTEKTSDRINRASSRARFDPAIREARQRNNVVASLGQQRFAEEQRAADAARKAGEAVQRQLQARSRIAASLGQQRFAEEQKSAAAVRQSAQQRSRVALGLGSQRFQEEERQRKETLTHDDVIRTRITKYQVHNALRKQTQTKVVFGEDDNATTCADFYLDQHMSRIQTEGGEQRAYAGVALIPLDGAIRMVRLSYGAGGITTVASRNYESDKYLSSYPIRRFREALEPNAATIEQNREMYRVWQDTGSKALNLAQSREQGVK